MKKFLFLAIAATAFASCSQDEVMEVAQKQAISFGESFVGNATRAIDPSHVATDINEFKVYGTLTGNNNNLVELYKGAIVTRGTAQNTKAFECTQTEYWTPNASYEFAAVAHANSVTCTNGLPSSIYFEYSTGTVDLLYTKELESVTTNDSATPNGVNANGCVAFTFDHLLSKLQFRFENQATSNNHIFRVKNIQIEGLPASGTCNVATTPAWSTEGATSAAVSFGNASNATTNTDASEAVDIKKGAPITSNNACLVIPNSNALTIKFVKELYLDADGDGVAEDNELVYSDDPDNEGDKFTSIPLNGTDVAADKKTTFAANGNYVLVVKLTSGGKIDFTVQTLNDWTTSANVALN